jgi:hypothetical protein
MHLAPGVQFGVQATPVVTPFDNFTATTTAVTGALGTSGRRVETSAGMHIPVLDFLEVNYRSGGTNNPILELKPFNANVDCKATGDPSTAVATASWSATATTWQDSAPNNAKQVATPVTFAMSSSNPFDQLLFWGTGGGQSNPEIYDNGTAAASLYLFNDPATGHLGYLESWSSDVNEITNISPDGRTVSASISGAIHINTVPVANTSSSPSTLTNTESAINLSIGKLSCNATDNR